MRTWLVVAMLCLLPPLTAQAKDVKLGDVTIKLAPPDGYCEIDQDKAPDKSFFQTTKATIEGIGNEMLLLAAECKDLREWRAHKHPLRHILSYQTPKDRVTTGLSLEGSKKTCDEIRERGQKIGDEQKGSMESAVRAASKDNTFLGAKILGVLENDPLGCFVGMVVRSKVNADTFVQLKVIYVGSLKERGVFSYLERPYQEGTTNIQTLLDEAKRQTKALKAANGM